MKAVMVTGPGTTGIVEVEQPVAGPDDVLVRIRACGICGSDHMYTMYGGIPPRQGATPLGHEPAGEVVEVGADVAGREGRRPRGDQPDGRTDGIIGSGGAQGAFSPYVVLLDAVEGTHFRVIPDEIPLEVAALNEPMAVARHAVNRSGAKPGEKVVVFGAGPIGLGALLGLKAKGVDHVVVIDILPNRLEKALAIGADAVINSAEEDVAARLIELHGQAPAVIGQRGARPATDVYLDAAGAPVVPKTVFGLAKQGARLGILAVHKKPVELDFGAMLTTELTIILSMGYPTEIFEVTDDIIANWEKYALIISHRFRSTRRWRRSSSPRRPAPPTRSSSPSTDPGRVASGGQRTAQRVGLRLPESTRDARLGQHRIEPVERAVDQVQVARNAGFAEPPRVHDVLVVEEVVRADADPRGRQAGQVVPPGRRCVRRDAVAAGLHAEVCGPREPVAAGRPHAHALRWEVAAGRRPVVERRVTSSWNAGRTWPWSCA